MEDEFTTSAAFRGYFEESFWKNNRTIGNKPLTMKHVLPCFMSLVFGLILSTIIFILERSKKISVEPIESGAGTTPHATITDNRKPKPKPKNINDTIMVMAEILESLSKDE